MRLAEMTIENFRSISKQTIKFDNYTAFVGPNGSGKSNILTALNIFFRNTRTFTSDPAKLTKKDFHYENVNSPIVISVVFDNLSDEAKKDFKHYVRQDKLMITNGSG